MKIILLSLAICSLLVACNDDETSTSTTTSDSSTHMTDHSDTSGSMSTGATTGGRSMMQIMDGMMQNMKSMQTTGNPDNDFAAMMKAHHLSAVEMIELELAQGGDPAMKQMAQKMLDEQQKEIAELNTFLSGHSAHGGGDAFFKEAMASMDKMTMNMNHSGSIDRQFAEMMISHHQGAIDMSNIYLKSSAHEEKLKAMARKIAKDQEAEIRQLQDWLAKNK